MIWRVLQDAETSEVWAVVHDRFRFNPSGAPSQWPDFAELTPSVTFSLTAHSTDADGDDFSLKMQAYLRRATPPGTCLYALDWQPACFLYDPHRVATYTPDGARGPGNVASFRTGTARRRSRRTACTARSGTSGS